MAKASGIDTELLDEGWLIAHPLIPPANDVDKNARGRVLAIGGSVSVPGGIRLKAEAALRAGAGKVRIGTVAPVAMVMGVQFPEVSILSLPVGPEGEIAVSPHVLEPFVNQFDAVVLGPAMSGGDAAAELLKVVLDLLPASAGLVVDAAALMALERNRSTLARRGGNTILTPHIGEMAAMLDLPAIEIENERAKVACDAAIRFNAVTIFKGATTLITEPGGSLQVYEGGNNGLATGGSGDVLAGIAGALLARGCTPRIAAGWATWLHGEAGSHCSESIGPLGYLASELLAAIPGAMASLQPVRN